jgi:hypothetical protein
MDGKVILEEHFAWFDAVPIDAADRAKIGRTNALRLFGLPGAA